MGVREDILREIRATPPPPPGAVGLLKTFFTGEFAVDRAVETIAADTVLSSHILKVADMLFHPREGEISSVQEASRRMGNTLFPAMFLSSCFPCDCDAPLEGYEAGRGALMRHGLGTAVAARELAGHARVPVRPDAAFAAGMLHDLGKVMLSRFLKGKAPELVHVVLADEAGDFLEAERGSLGTDHAEAGAALAERWNLPHALCQVLRFHHHPAGAEAAHRPLVYAAHLGDAAATLGGGGTGADAFLYRIDEGYPEYFDLDDKMVEQAVLAAARAYETLDACCPDLCGKNASRQTD